jgi:hypothetical protein
LKKFTGKVIGFHGIINPDRLIDSLKERGLFENSPFDEERDRLLLEQNSSGYFNSS